MLQDDVVCMYVCIINTTIIIITIISFIFDSLIPPHLFLKINSQTYKT